VRQALERNFEVDSRPHKKEKPYTEELIEAYHCGLHKVVVDEFSFSN
jgi:hypothetical protein